MLDHELADYNMRVGQFHDFPFRVEFRLFFYFYLFLGHFDSQVHVLAFKEEVGVVDAFGDGFEVELGVLDLLEGKGVLDLFEEELLSFEVVLVGLQHRL